MARASRGFTLIELIVTVAIVALLATAAMPVAQLAFKRTREQDLTLAPLMPITMRLSLAVC